MNTHVHTIKMIMTLVFPGQMGKSPSVGTHIDSVLPKSVSINNFILNDFLSHQVHVIALGTLNQVRRVQYRCRINCSLLHITMTVTTSPGLNSPTVVYFRSEAF